MAFYSSLECGVWTTANGAQGLLLDLLRDLSCWNSGTIYCSRDQTELATYKERTIFLYCLQLRTQSLIAKIIYNSITSSGKKPIKLISPLTNNLNSYFLQKITVVAQPELYSSAPHTYGHTPPLGRFIIALCWIS